MLPSGAFDRGHTMNAQQSSAFQPRVLGRTGLVVGPIGLSASYGVPTDAVERAFERGANYLYWGSLRRERFGKAIRHLAGQRDRMVLVLQSYMLSPRLITWNVERGLRRLNFGHADVLLLGHVTRDVPEPTLDAWRRLRDRGLVRFLAVSTHQRALVPALADNPDIGIIHLRYNAAHRGAEREIFPLLQPDARPGIVAYTATSWKRLLKSRRLPEAERVPTAGDCYRFALAPVGGCRRHRPGVGGARRPLARCRRARRDVRRGARVDAQGRRRGPSPVNCIA
jgi:aryl-alcohol dehydrogenase-like predicted oxidoreductase